MTSNLTVATGRSEPPRSYRWTVLVVVSLAMFGNYYPYDAVAPVADLLSSQLGFNDEQIGTLYSAYSVAAVLVLLAGGYVIDKLRDETVDLRVWGHLSGRVGGDGAVAGLSRDGRRPIPARSRR